MKTGAAIAYYFIFAILWPYYAGSYAKRLRDIAAIVLVPLIAFVLGMLAK